MALTATAVLADDPGAPGTWNPAPPTGHHGWNNTSGDLAWVPDEYYYRRVLLTLTGNAGETPNVVNWEIYGGSDIPFVADAATEATVDVPMVNNLATRTIWVRNATDWATAAPYYDETGTPWVSTLRANGNRVVIEFPAYLKWDLGVGLDSAEFYIEAFVPGAFGVPSATTSITIDKPNIVHIGDTGAVQPRVFEEPGTDDVPDDDGAGVYGQGQGDKPKKRRKKKAADPDNE